MHPACPEESIMDRTEVLYFPNVEACYLKEFDAKVMDKGPDFLVLDKTLFYAEAGGQPTDLGVLRWEGGESKVTKVTKEKGVIKHYVDALPPSDTLYGVLDWDRRFAHMRMHTSQHIVSGIAYRIYGARTVGNQIHADHSRVDLQPASFTEDDLKRIENEVNKVVNAAVPVTITEQDRVVVSKRVEDRALMDLIPQSIKRLRVVEIQGVDYCPCGGTHLRNTSEIGSMRIIERRSKGKETDRIVYELDPGPASR